MLLVFYKQNTAILGQDQNAWTLYTTNIGQKLGDVCAPFFGGRGSWVPIEQNVAWAKSTSMPCFILIHPTVWQMATTDDQRYREDRQDRTTVQ